MRFRPQALLLLSATVLAVVLAAGVAYRDDLPRRFAAVVNGRLYRSGEVTPAELELLARRYRIRRVISLLDPTTSASRAELAAADRLGIRWVSFPLPGDGSSTAPDRERIKAALFDESAGPTLVHCAAGTNRTGLAIGMYRIHKQHWTVAQVLEEMRRFSFDDLPKHQNLRDALAAEADLAARERSAAIGGEVAPSPSEAEN